MQQQSGFQNSKKQLVYRLNKAIYGLKKAPATWYDKLKHALLQFQFIPSKCDPSLFAYSKADFIIYILIYVDDIIEKMNDCKLIQTLVSQVNSFFFSL